MQISLQPSGDNACLIVERSPSTSNEFKVPLSKETLIAALRDVLADPEKREVGAAAVLIERMRDGLRVHAGSGSFLIKYQLLFPLIIEA